MLQMYKVTELDNGDILLSKFTFDATEYFVISEENGDKLLKKHNTIEILDINELKNYEFKKSSVIKCIINGEEQSELRYKCILTKIYELIDDGTKIIKNSILNIKTVKKNDEGYSYFDKLGISVQGVESNRSLREIINQCKENKISLKIRIKLFNNNIIVFSC